MSPISKKAKKEASEKELEGFLFGDNEDDLWTKTGQELDQKPENEQGDENSGDDEEGTEEVKANTKQSMLFFFLIY
jgi:U3 small nucleolar RNA-associated protein 18